MVRNFEFLFNLFEGLEVIYKKGYDRKKVENLFSNLEFTQLYDRNFDIPDFGVGSNPFWKVRSAPRRSDLVRQHLPFEPVQRHDGPAQLCGLCDRAAGRCRFTFHS